MEAAEEVPMEDPVGQKSGFKSGNQSDRSWVAVAKQKQSLKKYDLEISTSDGKKSVTVPAEITEKSNPLWEDFVIARFLETAPHIAKVHMIINKIWLFGEKSQKMEVYVIDEKTMRIRIVNEKIREKVVRRGMWNIAGVPMVVSKWSPEVGDGDANLIPLWVHLTNVPMSMYSWEGLSFMTSAVGVPDHLHPDTIACTNFDIAKVFVKADLSKEPPKQIDFTIKGEVVTVHYAYPWLPPRCVKCNRWGHYETFCKGKSTQDAEESKMMEGSKSDEGTKNDEEKQDELVVMNKQIEVMKKNEDQEGVSERNELEEEDKRNEGSNERSMGSGDKKIGEWKTISGEKMGRSKIVQCLQYGQVTIATPSRFNALRNTDEKGEELDKEEQEELDEEDKEEFDNETRGETQSEKEEDIYQSLAEESVEETKKSRARQILPRLSKTNHRVVIPETTLNPAKDMKRGSRKNHS